MSSEKRKYKRMDSIISGEFYSQADGKAGEIMVLDSSGGVKPHLIKPSFREFCRDFKCNCQAREYWYSHQK